jgi:hypothetical protein
MEKLSLRDNLVTIAQRLIAKTGKDTYRWRREGRGWRLEHDFGDLRGAGIRLVRAMPRDQ